MAGRRLSTGGLAGGPCKRYAIFLDSADAASFSTSNQDGSIGTV